MIQRYGIYEIVLSRTIDAASNPFVDVTLSAAFTQRNRVVHVDGFYDGDGIYRIRLMPDQTGEWTYATHSNLPDLDDQHGSFIVGPAAPGQHGPVRVANATNFAYDDGAPYSPIGTTCYVWNHQGDGLEERTLATLATAPFNKIRMCVFPKHYDYNHNEPGFFAFEQTASGFDWTRFNPAFFQRLEKRIAQLGALGIEADLILFHPYDRWGFSHMDRATDECYLRYIVARLSAFANVWWSFANEYDLMPAKSMQDWDDYFRLVQTSDPAQHLRSIHNCRGFYDHAKPWVTHCSIQSSDLHRAAEWVGQYGKPVVFDECCYEGNINHGWGNITAQTMVHRFWDGFTRGAYVGHGETFMHPDEILWWAKGGDLHGQSPTRIAFLRRVIEDAPAGHIVPIDIHWDVACAGIPGEYYLFYFGNRQPSFRVLPLPADRRFTIEVIDTWEMTLTELPGTHSGDTRVELPARSNIALRVRRSGERGRRGEGEKRWEGA